MPPAVFSVGRPALPLVLLLAAAVYVNTISYQFVWDDAVMVLHNGILRDIRNFLQFFRADFNTLTSGALGAQYYRPVLALSLALDASLWGMNPAAFHLTNILLHVTVTLLVARLALALGAGRPIALLAALLFALHPAHVEAVAFVSARDNLWVSIGVLGCLIAYRRSGEATPRRTAWHLAALGGLFLALLSKEVGIVLPSLLMLSEALLPPAPGQATWRRILARSLPYWGLTVAFMLFRLPALWHIAGDRLQVWRLWGRLPGALEMLARYVWLSLVPTHMQPFYALTRPTSLLESWPLLGMVVGGLLVTLLVWWWRLAPLAAFAVGWVLITLTPVLDFVPFSFREMGLADRYLYLPSVGVCILFAVGLAALLGPADESMWHPRKLIGWLVIIALLVLYPWHLLRYASNWQENLLLYSRMERAAPNSAEPAYNLGITYFEASDFPSATAALERAVRLDPTLDRPRALLGLAYVLQGRAPDGFRMLETLASMAPPSRAWYVARIKAHLFLGEWSEALGAAEEGARRFPGDAEITEWLGRALEQAGRRDEAILRYRKALNLSPNLYLVEDALGDLLVQSGQLTEAALHYQQSAEIQPERAHPVRGLGLLSEIQGDRTESLRLWRRVLELAPGGTMIREAIRHIRRLEQEGAGAAVSPGGVRALGAETP